MTHLHDHPHLLHRDAVLSFRPLDITQRGQEAIAKEDTAMSIGLEVHADIEGLRCLVQVLHTCLRERDLHAERSKVRRCCPVRVCSLNDT
jgi:hypothetical protein